MADDLPPGFSVVSGPTAAASTAGTGDLPSGFSVVQPAPEQPSTAMDVLKSAGSGVVRGAVETAMAPVTLGRLVRAGDRWLYDKGEGLVRSVFGLGSVTPEMQAKRDAIEASMPSTGLGRVAASGQNAVRQVMDENLHAPQTRAGKYAETIGEFAVPGGFPSKATRAAPTLARKAGEYAADLGYNAAIPGALSETAGQATEGTALEPYARLLGAIVGNGATVAGRAYYAPDMQVRRATEGMTDAQWQRAKELQDNSTGVRLSGPEAVAQATEGASALPDVLRVVEGSVTGRQKTAPFFAARPGQVDTAVGGMLDKIAPQSPQPSTLGPRSADAATNVIRDAEKARTAAVTPHYEAAATDKVPEDQVTALLSSIDSAAAADKTGILSGPLGELKNRLLASKATPGAPAQRIAQERPNGTIYKTIPGTPAVPEKPIVDIENLDRARKYFRDKMDLPQIGQDAITKEQNAAVTDILTKLDAAMEGASSEFRAGKQQFTDISRKDVDPLTQGPVGRVAAAGTTEGAGNAILPQNPLTGSGGETADAVTRLVAKDPEAVTGLIRQRLGDIYSKASTATRENNREFGGANFNKAVAGNPTRREVLDAVLGSIPGGRAAAVAPELLDVLAATGRRSGVGSRTAFNTAVNAELGTASPVGRAVDIAKTLGGSFLTQAGDAARRATLRGSLGDLADLFTDPQSVDLLRQSVLRGTPTAWPEALSRTGLELGSILHGGGAPLELTVSPKNKRQ